MNSNRSIGLLLSVNLLVVPLLCLGLGWLVWNGVYAPRLPSDGGKFTLGSVYYDTPASGRFQLLGYTSGDKDYMNDGVNYSADKDDQFLRQLAGHLYFEGLFYGSVHPQQTVLITDKGQVFVNGKERLPRALPHVVKHRTAKTSSNKA